MDFESEVIDRLARIETQLLELAKQKHEDRLKALESWRSYLVGGFAMLSVLVAWRLL